MPVLEEPLDDILNSLGIDEIDLMKVDIEGYTAEVLSEMISSLNKTKYLIIEISEEEFRYVHRRLRELGFRVVDAYGLNYLYRSVKNLMRLLYVGDKDIFSRHELGFIVALTSAGSVKVVDISSSGEKVIEIGSDNGSRAISVYPNTMLETLIDSCDAIFVTPRKPLLETLRFLLKKGEKLAVSLRLWSIRAAKLRDNLRFRAYGDILFFIPSILANAVYVAFSNYVLTVDYVTYIFAKRIYKIFASRIYKLYPPYGYTIMRE